MREYYCLAKNAINNIVKGIIITKIKYKINIRGGHGPSKQTGGYNIELNQYDWVLKKLESKLNRYTK